MCVCMCVYEMYVQLVHTWVHRMQCTFVHFRFVCACVCMCVHVLDVQLVYIWVHRMQCTLLHF